MGAAGIFPARTRSGDEITHDGLKVVELGSNYIHPDHRNHGLGEKLLRMRIDKSRQQGWFPVSVTSNRAMAHIFEKVGAIPMDDISSMEQLREQLCLCLKITSACLACPKHKKAAWYF